MKFNKAYLYFLISERNMSVKDFRKKVGISMTTWYKRMNDADTFTYAEMKEFAKALELSLEELQNIFFK